MIERLATGQSPTSPIETIATRETMSVPERLIKLDNNSINLEITEMCRTDCSTVCYTAGRARLTGKHLPLEILSSRIDWICRHTDAKYLFFLGGDPLLHPQLKEIIAYANLCGLDVEVVTSGVISGKDQTEQNNLALLLEKYEDGALGVQLSLHPGRNKKHFLRIIEELKDRTPARMAALQDKKRLLEFSIAKFHPVDESGQEALDLLRKQLSLVNENIDGVYAIHTTVTLGQEIAADEEKFIAIYRFIFEECSDLKFGNITIEGEEVDIQAYLHEQFKRLKKHFAGFGQSAHFFHTFSVPWSANKRWRVRVWGAVGVTKVIEGGRQTIRIKRPMGNEEDKAACPAMTSSADNDSGEIFLDGALIRADGELVHSQPGCIEMKHGFTNVDRDSDPAAIYSRVSTRLMAIDKLIHKIDNLHQSERPTADKGCVSCPFDIACNLCVNNASPRP